MNNYNHKKNDHSKPIKITAHAKLRLKERIGSYTGYKNWNALVKAARYKGRTGRDLTSDEQTWCASHIKRLHSSSQIRILNGYAFLFMGNGGRARTLVTVIPMIHENTLTN